MSDLISRKQTIKALRAYADRKCANGHIELANGILNAVCLIEEVAEVPPVEAAPAVHGEWVSVPSSDTSTGKAYECSNCKKMRYGSFMPPFCQMCGADMRKKV